MKDALNSQPAAATQLYLEDIGILVQFLHHYSWDLWLL
jgi:hypothetical protein